MKKYCILSIDPGKEGVIVYYSTQTKKVEWQGILNDTRKLYEKIKYKIKSFDRYIAIIEKAVAYKGQGVKSIMTYMINFGRILAILEILKFEINLVSPRTWQTYFNLTINDKDLDRYERRKLLKQRSIELAEKIWNKEINDHNLADALLMLKYFLDNNKDLCYS